jgi:glutathione S-transferase
MILYGSSMSPYVRKVMAFAAEKGIELEVQPTGIGDPNPDFVKASPFRKMPALVDGDFTLADSSAIVHYLEALHPQPEMIPADPRLRGKCIWYEEFADTILTGCGGKMFYHRIVAPLFLGRESDPAVADQAEREELPKLLDYVESVAPGETGYLVGDTLTLADLALASPFANLILLKVEVDADRWPKTAAYTRRILERPSFAPLVARELARLEKIAA